MSTLELLHKEAGFFGMAGKAIGKGIGIMQHQQGGFSKGLNYMGKGLRNAAIQNPKTAIGLGGAGSFALGGSMANNTPTAPAY